MASNIARTTNKEKKGFSTARQIVRHDDTHRYEQCRYCFPIYAMSVGIKSETAYLAGFQFCIDPNRLLPISLLYSDKADGEEALIEKLHELGRATRKFAPAPDFILAWHNHRWVVDANTAIPPPLQGRTAILDIHHNRFGMGLLDAFKAIFAAAADKDPAVNLMARMACKNNGLDMSGNPAVALGALYADHVRSNCSVTYDSLMYDRVDDYEYADWD